MFWQERKATPEDYLKKWVDMAVISPTESECWLMPHATWHRLAALTAQRMSALAGFEMAELVQDPPLTNAQKSAAWADTADIAAQVKVLADTLKGLKKADTINLCRVFKAARECATSSPFCGPPPAKSYLDPDVLNDAINKEIQKQDPIRDVVSEKGDLKDPLEICLFQYELNLDSIEGLSDCWVGALDVQMAYSNDSSPEGAIIRSKISTSTCPIHLA